MQKTLFLKLLIISFLMLLLLIPLEMIHGIIAARQARQVEVENFVAASTAGPQAFIGPILVAPYIERVIIKTIDDKGREKVATNDVERKAYFFPASLSINIDVDVEQKHKGLYKALALGSKGIWKASYSVPANLGLEIDASHVTPGKAYLAFGLSDVRGIQSHPQVKWQGATLNVAQGSGVKAISQGFHAPIGKIDIRADQIYEVELQLVSLGTRSLSIAPLGKNSSATVNSKWPHPNFGGQFLPRQKTITAEGFSATWEVSQLASKNDDVLQRAIALETPIFLDTSMAVGQAPRQIDFAIDTFSTAFIEPVNVYLKAERAVKYGIIFIALTFAAIFILETLKKLRIHPLQYGFIGLALAVFFLLVISLSEHIAFAWAYLAASTASIALLGYYLAHILKSRARGFVFACLFTSLYGVLYALLLSEDNALVLGALLLFAALAAIMALTRKVDWYDLGTNP